MSFLKKLFGLGGGSPASSAAKTLAHGDFIITAAPYKEQGQYQLCGVITKIDAGKGKEHRFVRADRFASYDEAVEMTLMKGRQIIDEQGGRLFN